MTSFKTNNVLMRTVAMVILVGAFVIGGCSQSPMQSADDSSPRPLTRISSGVSGASLSPVNQFASDVISAKKGGTLSLLDVTLVVPPNAVPNDTLFSIFIPDDEIFFNEFGTDGLVFDVPVTVTMSYRMADLSGVDESSIRIAWMNDATGEYEDIDCDVDFVNRTVTARLNHFSAYGLISD